jgi:hypothetical protein
MIEAPGYGNMGKHVAAGAAVRVNSDRLSPELQPALL